MRRARTTLITLAFIPALLAGCGPTDKAAECHRQGGVIEKEVETKFKNGKRTTKIEYECMKDGVELFEWK
jgi:hypothetical protein